MRVTVVASAICLCIVGVSAADDTSAAIKRHTDIPAERLDRALQALAANRGLAMAYRSELVGDRQTQGASGELTRDEALTQLLSGTGLTYRFLDEQTVTIVPTDATDTGQPTDGLRSQDASKDSEEAQKNSFWDRFHMAQAAQGTSTVGSSPGTGKEARSTNESSKAESSGTKLEEIIVTAQKRSEALQDVPIPVTAISAQALLDTDQLRLQDYYSSIPGLNVSPSVQGGQFLTVRGIATGGFTNPTVGIVLDDVPFGSSTQLGGAQIVPDIDPSDLARVEVLRGPQGTLYGASSMGGLLKFVTVDPSTDALSGRVQAGTSSVYNGAELGYNVRGSVNVPLGDTFAVRVSGFTHEDPGYIDNPVIGLNGINEERVSGGRISALWRPSDLLSLKVSALYQDAKGDGSNAVELPTAGFPQTAGLADLQQNDLRGSGWYDRRVQAYSAVLTAKLGNVDLTAVTGYNINTERDSLDLSYGLGQYAQQAFAVAGAPIINSEITDKITQEVRLSAPIGKTIDWLAGVFYTHERSPYEQTVLAVDPSTGKSAGLLLYSNFPTTYTEYAAFTDFTVQVTERFDIQLGGRESQLKEQTLTQSDTGYLNGSVETFVPAFESKSNAFTYLVTPRLKLSPDLMMYVRLASGYRAGGPNIVNPNSPTYDPTVPHQYKPDETRNYEIGVKGDFLEHTLSVDASLYYIDWRNIQLSLNHAGEGYNANGGGAKSQGMELSIESRPLAGLTIAAWIALSDAELTDAFPASSPAYGAAGDRLPYSSRFSGNVSLEQDFPLSNNVTGFVGAALNYVGDREDVFTDTALRQHLPAYAKTDLRAGAKYDSWTVNFFVNNVADKRGVLDGGLGTFPPFAFYCIQPRTAGLSVSKTF